MDEDIKNLESENTDVAKAAEVSNIDIPDTEVAPASDKQPVEDVSKVKIRTVLSQRFKKRGFSWKTVIAFILVGIICFAAGIGADRAFTRHKSIRMLGNRPGIERRMPMNRFNGRQQNSKNKQAPNQQTPNSKPVSPSN